MEASGAMRVVIAGGGVAGLEALLALRSLASDRVRVELVAPERDFVYKPLAVAEQFGYGRRLRFDLAALVAGQGAAFRPDAIIAVDPARRVAHTRGGAKIPFDALVVACGARSVEALPGAITFWGSGEDNFRAVVTHLEGADRARIALAVPTGAGWPLPVYELALLIQRQLALRGAVELDITIATPEPTPLELFGSEASELVAALLERRGISVLCGHHPATVSPEGLTVVPASRIDAERVLTIPRPAGRRIGGLPHDERDFIPADTHGRVHGLEHVYAAGDGTTFPVKQGGIAAQQADAVAEAIAAEAGAAIEPRTFRPVLRGLLLTGGEHAFLRAEVSGGHGNTSSASTHPLWWPPGKIAGTYLAPHLSALSGVDLHPPPLVDEDALEVEVALEGEAAIPGPVHATG